MALAAPPPTSELDLDPCHRRLACHALGQALADVVVPALSTKAVSYLLDVFPTTLWNAWLVVDERRLERAVH